MRTRIFLSIYFFAIMSFNLVAQTTNDEFPVWKWINIPDNGITKQNPYFREGLMPNN